MRTDFAPHLTQGQVQVATGDGELIGLIVTIDERDHEIRSVAVLPAFQRKGVGQRLMAQAEAQARALGYETIRLYTNAKLPELVRMYEGMGFTQRERRYDGGYDRVFLTKAI